MNDNEGSLQMFGQDQLKTEVRDAALAAALAALLREKVTPAAAVRAYGVDLLLAGVSDGQEHTDGHYREHGASLHAFEAYWAAKDAAKAEIAKLDPANAGFVVLFSVAN